MKFILYLLIASSTLVAIKVQHISVAGVSRDYYVHVPKTYKQSTPMPLVIFLHGGGQNVKKLARKSLLNKLSDEKKFMLVYPVGIDKHWNDGRGVTYAGKNSVDDVQFIKTLINTLVTQYAIEEKKIYVTGVSNGGMMSFRLGCELSDKLLAIAPVIANMPTNYQCTPKSPLSVLLMNGTKDPIVPWEGGSVQFWKKRMGEVHSTLESISFWREHNDCQNRVTIHHLPNHNRNDKSTVKLSSFKQCKNNTSVELYAIEGAGHTLPSKKGFNMPRLVGEKNRDIEGIRVIVEFLLQINPKNK